MRGHRRRFLLISMCMSTAMLWVAATPALAAPGDLQWTAQYDGGPGSFDQGTAVVASPDGSRVYVVGDLGFSSADAATVAYDAATGAALWAATFNGPGDDDDRGEAVAVSPDGSRVYAAITGRDTGGNDNDVFTIAYDAATGSQLWVAQHDGDGLSEACCVAVSPDGSRVYVAGAFGNPDFSRDGLTIAYDAATGSQLWSRRYQAGTEFLDLAVSPNGSRVFSVGVADFDDAKGDEVITVAHNASTGKKVWVRRYDSKAVEGSDIGEGATSVAVAPDSQTVFVGGNEGGVFGSGDHIVTLAYAAGTGAAKWRVRSPDSSFGPGGPFVVVAPDGSRVFVAVTRDKPMDLPDSSDDFWTVAYNPVTGAQLWESTFDHDPGPLDQGIDQVVGLAMFDSSKVFVAGVGCTRIDENTCVFMDDAVFRTVSYSASTGAQRWTRAFDVGGGSEAAAVAARGGRVFVTGTGSGDILTVAYAA